MKHLGECTRDILVQAGEYDPKADREFEEY